MKPKVIKMLNLDKSKVDDRTKMFMDFFEKQLGVQFVDVTQKVKNSITNK